MPDPVFVVVAVLAFATAIGLWWRARNGRYTAVDPTVLAAAGRADDATPAVDRLGSDDLGAALGARGTFVQFSSEVCAPCRRTHAVLGTLVAEHADLAHVDLDVAEHLDLVRRFNVLRTPTTLLLDDRGVVVGRLSGGVSHHHAVAALDHLPATSTRSTP